MKGQEKHKPRLPNFVVIGSINTIHKVMRKRLQTAVQTCLVVTILISGQVMVMVGIGCYVILSYYVIICYAVMIMFWSSQTFEEIFTGFI